MSGLTRDGTIESVSQGQFLALPLVRLDGPFFDEGLIIRGQIVRVHLSGVVVVEDLCCLYHRTITYIQTFLTFSQEDRKIMLRLRCILSVSHVFTVQIVGVGKEGRTKSGQSGFLNRQHSLLELPCGLLALRLRTLRSEYLRHAIG